jgi:hypothetical protein
LLVSERGHKADAADEFAPVHNVMHGPEHETEAHAIVLKVPVVNQDVGGMRQRERDRQQTARRVGAAVRFARRQQRVAVAVAVADINARSNCCRSTADHSLDRAQNARRVSVQRGQQRQHGREKDEQIGDEHRVAHEQFARQGFVTATGVQCDQCGFNTRRPGNHNVQFAQNCRFRVARLDMDDASDGERNSHSPRDPIKRSAHAYTLASAHEWYAVSGG